MTTQTQRESATIYQFPARGRFASAKAFDARPQSQAVISRDVQTALGGAWYHDEAIRDAQEPRKN